MIIAANITELRKANDMTQAELAEKMMVTRQTVSRWEAGTGLPDLRRGLPRAGGLRAAGGVPGGM